MNTIQSYLKKRGISGPWKIASESNQKFDRAVIIPAYSESEYLPKTLASLNENNPSFLKDTLIVVVINNAENSPEYILKNNQHCFELVSSPKYRFSLGIVDAFSNGLALPPKHAGVGLARKIGMDLSLPHLTSPQSLIFCTDADTQVSPDYLSKVKQIFKSQNTSAAVIGSSHLKSQDSAINDAIGQYEKFLKTTAEKIQRAGSPYGYVSMGSTIVCTAEAYCAVGGMPRKKATEDFYFLQELTKYCGVHNIPDILVFPSPRPISRVHLGTGFHMEQIQNGFDITNLYYSNDAFLCLSNWLQFGSIAWKVPLHKLLNNISDIHPQLVEFLKLEGIEDVWSKIQNNAPSKSHFTEQFHRWFDGLKTIRFLKRFTS
jgi:glycosyltransferase involved in cell wall biosynthesis